MSGALKQVEQTVEQNRASPAQQQAVVLCALPKNHAVDADYNQASPVATSPQSIPASSRVLQFSAWCQKGLNLNV
jgi:hypothetical protein